MRERGSALGNSQEFRERCLIAFGRAVVEMGLPVSAEDSRVVEAWLEHYVRWPGRRVVGFEDPEETAVKLLADSYAVRLLEQSLLRGPALDLGSGNGWPGLALCSLGEVCLLDSRVGACDFMQGFADRAKIPGLSVVQARAEEAGRSARYASRFGVVTTRAMASPAVAIEVAGPFLGTGGLAVLWLGPSQEHVVAGHAEVREAGLALEQVRHYSLAGGLGDRMLAVYRKVSAGLPGFPRKITVIRAKPLF